MKNKSLAIAKKEYIQKSIFCLICFAVVSFIIILPLWNKAQIFGHDAWYHITRIEALKQQILDSHPFSRINYFFNQGEGYASSLCYPDLLLYIPAIFRIIGIDINVSYNIFLMLLGIACYGTTFYAANKMTNDKCIASICACLFTLCQYHLDNILTRGSVGEIQAFIFIPLAVYGIYNYLYEDFSHPAVMGIGFIGLILSHTITTFLTVLIYIILFLINIPKIIKAPKNLIKLGITAGFVLLATAFYWLPLIELMTKMDLKVSHPTRVVSDSGVLIQNILADIKMDTENNLGIGISVFILLILRIFIKKSKFTLNSKKNKSADNTVLLNLTKCADMFAITGATAAFCSTNLFPWSLFVKTPLNSIQFAWRLYIIASVFMSFASAIYVYVFIRQNKVNTTIVCAVIASIICILGFVHTKTAEPHYKYRVPTYFTDTNNYSDGFDGTCRTGGAEWLPYITATNKSIAFSQSNIVKDENGNTYDYEKDGTTIIVSINSDDVKTVQVPLIYYIGYTAEYMDSDGHITNLKVQGTDDCGLCEVNIPNKQGTLKVYYKGTALQKISLCLSIISVIGLIAYIIFRKRRKAKND